MATPKILFLIAGTSWTIPNDWNSANNTVAAIGAGGNSTSSTGGNGGCYALISNFNSTPGTSISYTIGQGNVGSNTWFSSTSTLLARGNYNSVTGSVGSTIHAGGLGNTCGGGAGGPNGAGLAGNSSVGGTGDNGSGGLGGNNSVVAQDGTEWTATGGTTAGSGGGGASPANMHLGGSYGGGAGAGGVGLGYGANGIVVVSYYPLIIQTKVIFLTSGTSWTVPDDWNSANNTIEAIGGAGNGYTTSVGGGGGAYAIKNDVTLTPKASVSYQIGIGNGTSGAGTSFTVNTWFLNGTTLIAAGGSTPTSQNTPGVGGSVANSVGDLVYAGGDGGTANGSASGGGGGAAGPNGGGITATNDSYGGVGDNGNGGLAGVGNPGVGPPGSGGNGSEWTATAGGTAGAGGGGGGAGGQGDNGAAGGLYGGGGGGANSGTGGAGQNGVIVITYVPLFGGIIPQFMTYNFN